MFFTAKPFKGNNTLSEKDGSCKTEIKFFVFQAVATL